MPTPPLSDELAFAAVEAVRQHGTVTAAALALGISRTTFDGRYKAGLQRQAAAGIEAPYIVRGTSTYFDSEGNARAQWVKTSLDDQKRQEMFRAAAEAMASSIPPIEPIPAPRATDDALCNLYTYSDFHLGMLSQAEEGGADWDLKIAERTLVSSFEAMVRQSPAADNCVINIQGDMLHSDGLLPVTPAHKHVLDQDGRFAKIVSIAIRSIRRLVALALERHRDVHLIICEGNHDEASSVWLRLMFAALYELEPRVTVNDSVLPFYVFQWGDVMLGFHHGHKVKNEQLPLLFAAQFPKVWGATTRRAIHCGHRHHVDEKEYNGVTIVQHPTIAARDAYAARGGWIADRAVQGITYHKRFGQVGRVFVSPEMLAA